MPEATWRIRRPSTDRVAGFADARDVWRYIEEVVSDHEQPLVVTSPTGHVYVVFAWGPDVELSIKTHGSTVRIVIDI